MRVGPISIQSRNVEVQTTHATPAALRSAIATAYVKVTGKQPTPAAVDALSAQAMVETARGTSMINYNFGGIKGTSPAGLTTHAKTVEVTGGKLTHIVDGFRAYNSLEDGATDYVRVLHNGFPAAFSRAQAGDIDGFAHELKAARYYTASEPAYAAALHAQSGTSSVANGQAMSAVPAAAPLPPSTSTSPDRFARAAQITRIMDAISSSAARILGDGEPEV